MRFRIPVAVLCFAAMVAHAASAGDPFETIRQDDLAALKLQLAAGADARDARGNTLLIYASAFGSMEAVRLLLDSGTGVNARNGLEATALVWAAADPARLRLLLGHGAEVNVHSRLGRTPLMVAAACDGCSENVRLLIEKGADVKAADTGGTTALALASQAGDLESIRLLLAHGADAREANKSGLTPLMQSLWNCSVPAAAALEQAGARDGGPFTRAQFHLGAPPERPPVNPAKAASRNLLDAVQSATALLEQSSTNFFQQAGCVGCHHQVFALLAASSAREAGVSVDRNAAAGFVKMMEAELTPAKEPLMERLDPGGLADGECYMLEALAADRYPANAVTDTAALHIAALQHRAGNWHVGDSSRSPVQEGDIARTARCLHALAVYAPPARKAGLTQQMDRARAWLDEARPATNDDFAMRLAGLAWAAASRETIAAASDALLARQRPDGGWAQNDHLASDAFATGESLWALAGTGAMPASGPAYQRGVRFLMDSQWPDGSWYVRSRAPKFQPYFQSGFPFDHDQWVSSAATGWAVMALAPAIPKEKASR